MESRDPKQRHVSASVLLLAGMGIGLCLVGLRRVQPVARFLYGPAKLEANATERTVQGRDGERTRYIDIQLTNTGGEPIRLRATKGTCGCPRPADVSGIMLQPRESLTLPVEVDLPPYGEKVAAVQIFSDAAASRELEVRLRILSGRILKPQIAYQPSRLRVAGTKPGDAAIGQFVLTTVEPSGSPAWIVRADCEIPDTEIELPQHQRWRATL